VRATFALRQLPGPGVPAQPARHEAKPFDEWIHRSYMMQWFAFAAIALFGPLLLVRSRRRREAGTAAAADAGDDATPGPSPRP
jgi:hypothetical protein